MKVRLSRYIGLAFILIWMLFLMLSFKNQIPNFSKKNVHHFDTTNIQEGDIIFQSSKSGQSLAVQLATKSKYSHCGLILKLNNQLVVLEAVQPVKYTALELWIKHGDEYHFVVKRLKNRSDILNQEVIRKMKLEGEKLLGKKYDIYFEWSDDKIYCSELVWKIYQQSTGLEVGKLQRLKEFELTNPEVKRIMKERYGNKIPLEEIVISPVAIFESDLLETIASN